MNKSIHQKKLVLIVAAVTLFWILQLTEVHSSEAGEWFSITVSGDFMPEAGVETTDASFSNSQLKVELSAPVIEVGYTLTSFSWDKGETLPFGNGRKVPWDQLHEISFSAKHTYKLNDTWAYLFESKGSTSFEEQIDYAYLKGRFLGGFRYTLLNEKLYLLFGGGVKADDFKTTALPAGGFQWDIGYGVSVSAIFPKEAEISYKSPDQKLAASVDILGSSAEIGYKFSPSFEAALSYDSEDSLHRLSDDSPVELVTSKTYLNTNADVVSLQLNYSPFKHLICNAGLSYYFSRKLSLLDDNEDTLEELEVDDALGGTFSLMYIF